jgi:hypothetical protein
MGAAQFRQLERGALLAVPAFAILTTSASNIYAVPPPPPPPVLGLTLGYCPTQDTTIRGCGLNWLINTCQIKIMPKNEKRWESVALELARLEFWSMLQACVFANRELEHGVTDQQRQASLDAYAKAKKLDPSVSRPDFENTYGIK